MEKPKDEDGEIVLLRKQRRQLIEQVDNQRQCREQYLKNLNSLMPDLAETLELTVKVVSSFGGLDISTKEMPLTRHSSAQLLALHSSGRVDGILDLQLNKEGKITPGKPAIRAPLSKTNLGPSNGADNDTERDASSEAFGIVKGIVINCLMAPNITFPIDSTGVFRRLGKDSSPSHRAALSEVGGEGGGVAAVEAALKAIGEGSMPAAEIEECTLGGKSRLMVLMVDRGRLIKELSEFSQLQSVTNDSNNNIIQGSGAAITDVPHGVHSMSTRSDMWVGTGDQSLQVGNMGVPPLPGTCPPMFTSAGSPMIGPRGPRVMGMMGMPGPGGASAMGMAYGAMPFQRPPLGPNPGLMPGQGGQGPLPTGASGKMRGSDDDVMKDLEALLSKKSFRELQKSKTGEELLDLLHRPTAKETAVAAKFKTKGGSALKEYCSALTKEDCRRQRNSYLACEKVHFRRIIALHTDVNLGDCSFLDTCRHMKTCKYVHYELDPTPDVPGMMGLPPPQKPITKRRADYCSEVELGEPQWINCDIRNFKMDVLGKFGVIMADPPWDIHMELPYGTMADDEMRNLNVPALQTDGLIFLWVTGRAMELGRECLELWGYKRVEELIWVKTNQLQRIIRTGRTGHWLNHSKEHCLVGIKGHPEMNRNIDTDVIVAEVRETSRKPDEMYPMLERISPRTRKLELFARMHNTHAGWISLGNQLNGVRLVDEGLRARFKAAYPDVEVQPSDAPANTTSTEEGETAPQGNSSPKSAGKEANVTNSVEKVLTDEKVHQESET